MTEGEGDSMSDSMKNSLAMIREYSKEIIMFLGFGIAFLVYTDFKSFMTQQTEVLQKIESRLTAIETEEKIILDRMEDLEKKAAQ